MKTKQAKEDSDKSIDEENIVEPKTRARKKASDIGDEDKGKHSQDEAKTSKEPKKTQAKPKAVVKKRPLGIRKALRSKKAAVAKEKVKAVIKKTITRARRAAIKTEPDNSQEKDTVPLIPASEIKKEPVDDTPNSRSSSPRTAGRRQRLSSDMIMMKSMLADPPSSLVVGPRTSPYSMRSERSNSPSLFEGKNLRSGKPRKVKSNLLNEVVMKEQKKRRRLLSDSKTTDAAEASEDCKKLKRGRSCSRDGSEISKCSDNTESDLSLSESLNDTDSKELNKKLDKPKTDLDIDIENNVQISSIEKVPSLNTDSKLAETKPDTEPSSINEKNKNKLSLKRSTSLDSDNNNSNNRLKLDNLNSSDIEDKVMKTENDTLFEARSSILTSMSKTFNSKQVSKNMRKARRGRRAAATKPASQPTSAVSKPVVSIKPDVTTKPETIKPDVTTKPVTIKPDVTTKPELTTTPDVATVTNDTAEDKTETLESLSKEIDDLINNLDQNICRDGELTNDTITNVVENSDQIQTKTVSKFYGLSKPLGDNNSIISPETPVKDTLSSVTTESTPSKIDDSENIRLHYEEDSLEKSDSSKQEKTYKVNNVASIDLLMDRLKEFEEFDKRRQRQESESRSNDSKPLMVTSDVVLINKSGTDIKQLKDIQTVRSPERPLEKENFLSCFENNSAISIVKRDQFRKSIDVDLPNSVTLIKRNSISARKESTSSNHSKESDALSIFEKSLGKDVTLTEIRKSVDKSAPTTTQVDLHQFATLLPNNPSQALIGVVLDTNQISILPRVVGDSKISNDVQITKRPSRESLSRKTSESANEGEEKMATIERIKSPQLQMKSPQHNMKSPQHQMKSPAISITPAPVAIKSPEVIPMETEALPPPLESVKPIPDVITLTTELPKLAEEPKLPGDISLTTKVPVDTTITSKVPVDTTITSKVPVDTTITSKVPVDTTISPEITVDTTITPKVSVDTTITPKVSVDTTITPNVSVDTTITPNVSLDTTITPKVQVDTTLQELSNAETMKANEVTRLETHKTDDVITDIIKEPEVSPTEIIKEQEAVEKLETPEKMKLEQKEEEKLIAQQTAPEFETKPDPKVAKPVKENKSARNSVESQPGPSSAIHETPESQKRKENVLRTLGLLTHKAAKEAKIEKAKEKERIYGSNYSGLLSNKNKAVKSGSGDYTGTLKTVIKLNRSTGERDRKKYRSSLKITFQKSKNRSGKPTPEVGEEATEEDSYYTIERREIGAGAVSEGAHRKSYSNRLNHDAEAVLEPTEPKDTVNLVIPEKASSFSIHPGRLCMDQCFYCGGKFGLFDTPCHIAAMKSAERQKKVLDNEEKLTIDSCLCDACYRHVDRRANCPSYRKRPAPRVQRPIDPMPIPQMEKQPSPPPEDDSSTESPPPLVGARPAVCHTEGCSNLADHSIRRKWLIKMRSSVNKVLKLQGDYPGLHTIPLCAEHHRALAPLMSCVLCRRRLTKHHNVHFIHQGYEELNPLLAQARLPVVFASRPVLCKLCRYYCTLLQRPHHNSEHARAYTRKLLQIYNIEVPPESDHDPEESNLQDDANKQKKKPRTKSKQRRSDAEQPSSESSEKPESSPEKDKVKEENDSRPLEEDIESLISSNKILVPGAIRSDQQSSEVDDSVYDFDTLHLPVDKQTELQYLLQKQNNPAQFMHQPNLTQKHKNVMKVNISTGIQKPSQQHKINDKNSKRIHKIGQQIIMQKDKVNHRDETEMFDPDKSKEGVSVFKNLTLNDECTIESIPNKKPADINTLKNKWVMTESFTQVRKNLSELSKKITVEKDSKKSCEKYSNPVKRLETNPSISVRELFPGEEEMNLQCNIEFNNVKGVTPEGWEKCNTMIQYDMETKRMWTELQRPYGNQSSFLRHLILLEKYFRSGDLVLSHNATPHAANYSDSVQSRLRAYDNVVNDTPRRSEPAISLIEYRKKPSINGKSLLKSNQSEEKEAKKMPPPFSKPKPKTDKSKSKPLPPELIAIHTPSAQGRKAIQNVLHNIQQLVKGVSASDPTEVAAAPLPQESVKEKKEAPKETERKETPKKSRPTSKPWRPTLMPITPENLAKIAREPTQVAVDGRHLPSLVQVMSSGKRYHITLQDYNKMCVMRREKLQQLQDGEKVKKPEETIVTEIQTSAMLGNGGTLVQNIMPEDKKEIPELSQISSNAATILKNVGLKNITIAPIPPKTATVTSQTMSPIISSPSLLVTSTPVKIPQLGPAVSITSETILTPNLPIMSSSSMIMPKIPKSLTVIPQTISSLPQSVVVPHSMTMAVALPQSMAVSVPQTVVVPNVVTDSQRP